MSETVSTPTAERIVTATAELMRRQGYGATSVKQITAAARAPIGSLYHHFPQGKQQIAAAALRTSGAAYIQLLPLLMDPYPDLRVAVVAAFTAAAEQIEQSGWMNMCPVGTVAGEIADSEPALREVTAEVMQSWIDQGSAYFRARGLPAPAAHTFVIAILGALEGAFILSRTLRSTGPIESAGLAMAAYLDTLTETRFPATMSEE
ncbi:putative HTH-type transcriptional regulator YxaF [Nocardia cerradoensis]|uniref:Putative HTH-type transcriptional regulator YxaF n=1 Tax=Nocardia cerradoensis TaxID=85688 RepID=A0A231GZK2_9NOCA|nr:TetR/AcrR family transcriptional regulator [Nocardia cerradoensis]OXR42043.1 putative HTH-type transcriptional regulator YxaF [Nocardia cerradoensis]